MQRGRVWVFFIRRKLTYLDHHHAGTAIGEIPRLRYCTWRVRLSIGASSYSDLCRLISFQATTYLQYGCEDYLHRMDHSDSPHIPPSLIAPLTHSHEWSAVPPCSTEVFARAGAGRAGRQRAGNHIVTEGSCQLRKQAGGHTRYQLTYFQRSGKPGECHATHQVGAYTQAWRPASNKTKHGPFLKCSTNATAAFDRGATKNTASSENIVL